MYLATVIDLASRRVVGWAKADHLGAELVCQALEMAIRRRRPGPGLIFHSDRGSQYTASGLRKLLTAHGIRQSLSRPRQVWDSGGGLLLHAEGGADSPPSMAEPGSGKTCDLRVELTR
jgi:putative transposase